MRLTNARTTVMRALAPLGRGLEEALMPNSCVFCGARRTVRQSSVCDDCHRDLPWIEPIFRLQPFACAAAPLDYSFPVDAAIKMFKFRRKLFYAPAFAHLLQGAIGLIPEDVDALLPVPLHWRRQTLRGFNQALEVARPLAREMALPMIQNVIRSRATPYQSGLAANHRRRNLEAAFKLRGPLAARHVLVFDDVITTGTTCQVLSKLLLRAGAEKVSALAIARVSQD